MKCLVTGGAGFIGSNLVMQLENDGHDVIVLDNLLSGNLKNIEGFKTAKFIKGDICNSNDISNAIAGCEVVFHMAASVGNKRSIDNPVLDAEINVIGTLRLLEAARKEKEYAETEKVLTKNFPGVPNLREVILSANQQHLFHFPESLCLQAVKIHSAAQFPGIPAVLMVPCREIFRSEGAQVLPQGIVDFKRYIHRTGQVEFDGGGGIKRIGVILF